MANGITRAGLLFEAARCTLQRSPESTDSRCSSRRRAQPAVSGRLEKRPREALAATVEVGDSRVLLTMRKFSCEQYFPRELAFSSEERAQYLRLVHELVHETLDEYAEYRTVPYDATSIKPLSTSVLDPLEWKEMNRNGGLTIYKDCTRPGANTKSNRQKLRRPGGGHDVIESKWAIPTMLTLGHISGRLHDTMYGAFVDSEDGFRLRSSYLHDDLDDVKILHTFEGPSIDDPFRFCGIVWYVYGHILSPIMRRRDNVLLVAMGMTRSREGDRIGYHVMHSVNVPALRPLTQYKIERAYGSMVFVKRQWDDQRVEMFQKGFFTPMGAIPDFAVGSAVMKGILRCGNSTVEASLSKKLYWMMQDAARARKRSSETNESNAEVDADDDLCAGGCKRRLNGSSSRGTCRVCYKRVCSDCKVVRKITLEASFEGVLQKAFCFCSRCVTFARNTSALKVATREFLEQDCQVMLSSFLSVRSDGSTASSQPQRKAHVLWQPE